MAKVPNLLYAQLLHDGTVATYELDPRTVHDNGKPVYLYKLLGTDRCLHCDSSFKLTEPPYDWCYCQCHNDGTF